MDEVEKTADQVAIIDNGKIVATGSPQDIITRAGTTSLEEAFINLTGHNIRAEDASGVDQLRSHARLWGRRR